MISHHVEQERIRVLMDSNGVGILIALANLGLLLGFLLRDSAPSLLPQWGVVLALVLVARLGLFLAYRTQSQRLSPAGWEWVQTAAALLSGGLWGGLLFALPVDALPEDVLIVLAVIIGTAAGAAFSAHASRQVAAIQMISLLGVMLAGLDQPFLRHYLAPVLVFTVPFCLFLLYYTFRFNTLMKQRLTLQLRNAALLADLTAEQSRLQQEIAERQRNAEALQAAHDASLRAAAAKDRFLSSVSHELRTPLNAVIGFVDLVVDIWPDPLTDRQSRALESVRQSGRHLHALVTDILDYSSCLQGDMPVNCQPVLLQDVLPDCLTALQPQAQRAAIQLPDGDGFYPGRVLADPRRLRQILFNLLGNAVKYNREGGVVMLRIAPDGDMIRIEIEDSGVGIPPMQRDRLFEAFNRLGREASSIEGSGLGLALSRRLTELMGGTLDYVPADGGGSLFILALPSAA